MKNIFLYSLPIVALALAASVNAGFYKGLDEEGNVIYSDKPFDNAEKINPPALTVMDAPKIKPKEEVKEEPVEEFKYTDFDITSPANNQTIWNEPELTVTLKLKPELNVAMGHKIWLMMDNKPLIKNSQSTSLQIGRQDRGAHQLQAQVRDENGKVIVRTRPTIVHLKYTVVPQRAPR